MWDDARSIGRYVGAQPHRDAVHWLRASAKADFSSARWSINAAAVPPAPDWEDALTRLEAPLSGG